MPRVFREYVYIYELFAIIYMLLSVKTKHKPKKKKKAYKKQLLPKTPGWGEGNIVTLLVTYPGTTAVGHG